MLLKDELGDKESFEFGAFGKKYKLTDNASIIEAVDSMCEFTANALCVPFDPEIMTKAVMYEDTVEPTFSMPL